MEQGIVLTIALQPDVDVQDFESYFKGEFAKHLQGERLLETTSFALYRAIESSNAYACVIRFQAEELDRVSRAAWPFIILAIRDLLNGLREQFDADVSVLSAPITSVEELVSSWNEQFGRFSKLEVKAAGEPAKPSA